MGEESKEELIEETEQLKVENFEHTSWHLETNELRKEREPPVQLITHERSF